MLIHSKSFPAFLMLICSISLFSINTVSADMVDSIILQTFQKHNTKFLCLSSKSSLPTLRKKVEEQLNNMGLKNSPTANDVAKATYIAFPCPFSPARNELRRATKKDIAGVWLFPEASIKLKFGPNSPLKSKYASLRIKCESIAYYSDGETRHAVIGGKNACPFTKASDMDISRYNPKVSSWKMLADGVLKITRTDVANHIEEWDIFTVMEPFKMLDIKFEVGDLLSYIKKENGNNFNVATQFRHLKRLQK